MENESKTPMATRYFIFIDKQLKALGMTNSIDKVLRILDDYGNAIEIHSLISNY